ncbi:MAG: hypothetical protein ACRDZ8_04890, partial [Acidimicrobiales bacterium]
GYDAYEPSEEGLLVTVEAEWQACDGLRARLVAELRAGTLPAPALVEMALVVRFLQRIGDHAVGTARGIDAPAPGNPRSPTRRGEDAVPG